LLTRARAITRATLPESSYPTTILPSTDVGRPFYYLLRDDWASCWAAFDGMTAIDPVPFTDFYKYRGAERDCVGPLWMYSAFWFWPFAPWGSQNVAAWLSEQLEAEPDLLAASYTDFRWVNVGVFLWQWALPLFLLTVAFIAFVWSTCYCCSGSCRSCTDRRARATRDCTERFASVVRRRSAVCLGRATGDGEMEGLTGKTKARGMAPPPEQPTPVPSSCFKGCFPC